MARNAMRDGADIVYKLARQFSRGAAAFAPVAFPGRIPFPGPGLIGLDKIAPVKRQWLTTPALPDYDKGTYAFIQPGFGVHEGNRFASKGTTRNQGLMPLDISNDPFPNDPGGNPDIYDTTAWDYEG